MNGNDIFVKKTNFAYQTNVVTNAVESWQNKKIAIGEMELRKNNGIL